MFSNFDKPKNFDKPNNCFSEDDRTEHSCCPPDSDTTNTTCIEDGCNGDYCVCHTELCNSQNKIVSNTIVLGLSAMIVKLFAK